MSTSALETRFHTGLGLNDIGEKIFKNPPLGHVVNSNTFESHVCGLPFLQNNL